MKRTVNILFIMCAMAFLLVVMYATVLREQETYSYYENRALAAMPEVDDLGDGGFFVKLEKYLSDHSAGRNTITRLSTAIDLFVLKRPVVNDVVVGDEILLPFNAYEVVDMDNIAAQAAAAADNIAHVAAVAESVGGMYLYTAVPCQYAYCEDEYPEYLNDREEYTDASVSALRERLEERGVNFLDMGEVFEAKGSPVMLSSTVDNHFSIFGAYETYSAILKALNDAGGNIPVVREDELVFEPMENYYMGSRTRKLNNLIKNDEKIYRVTPVTPVEFVRYNNGAEGVPTMYAEPGNIWEPVLYTYYMGGDIAETQIDTSRDELPTVLIYGDSFTNAVECIMYLSCDTMYSVDMRHYKGTISEYIEEKKPDYVICLRDYEALLTVYANGGK